MPKTIAKLDRDLISYPVLGTKFKYIDLFRLCFEDVDNAMMDVWGTICANACRLIPGNVLGNMNVLTTIEVDLYWNSKTIYEDGFKALGKLLPWDSVESTFVPILLEELEHWWLGEIVWETRQVLIYNSEELDLSELQEQELQDEYDVSFHHSYCTCFFLLSTVTYNC